jgi:hypothetical protein
VVDQRVVLDFASRHELRQLVDGGLDLLVADRVDELCYARLQLGHDDLCRIGKVGPALHAVHPHLAHRVTNCQMEDIQRGKRAPFPAHLGGIHKRPGLARRLNV